jgi:ribosome-associated protein
LPALDPAELATPDLDPAVLAAVHAAAAAIWDKKGFDVTALRVREIVQYTDCLVIASATSDRHAVAIAQHVEDQLLKSRGQRPIGQEGMQHGRWIVVDYSDFVVHVFQRAVRSYYELDRLYADAPKLDLPEPAWVAETSPDSLEAQAMDVGELLWTDDSDEETEDM